MDPIILFFFAKGVESVEIGEKCFGERSRRFFWGGIVVRPAGRRRAGDAGGKAVVPVVCR